MIINIWSTPRTGSVWYSCYQTYLHNGYLISEPFNTFYMIYHKSIDGRVFNLPDYEEGSFYIDYFLEDGAYTSRKVFGKRERTVEEEEQYRLGLIEKLDLSKTHIIRNHVSPLSESIRKRLLEIGQKNFYTYRKDKRAQLASYAIAFASKEFMLLDENKRTDDLVDDIDTAPLEQLIERIKVWDKLEKEEVIAYEEMPFQDILGFPVKQNKNHYSRLSNRMIMLIDKLVSKYEMPR